MNERIDHAAEARQHIDWAHDHQESEGITERTVTDMALLAQAHATLALVEQQRIASLIALWQGSPIEQSYCRAAEQEIFTQDGGMRPDIAAALGIEEVQP